MKFIETELKGAFIVVPELLEDERGFFARTWCKKEFEQHELLPDLVQCNISFNQRKGTLRGMHFQTPPRQESKLVRCTMGAIYDVIIDLRRDGSRNPDTGKCLPPARPHLFNPLERRPACYCDVRGTCAGI